MNDQMRRIKSVPEFRLIPLLAAPSLGTAQLQDT
ncbi:hypothetical protein RvY_08104 [Ramazzottius varieornatus]|uniref:Uncharacterized protein n=1 Tax=Ramazzottius varieornatus TaxID=947166 RepID=A0A1D1V4K9_RAMVA|nr:hypothetical protein RvY_08104 [Ramazzottius varieornatus]